MDRYAVVGNPIEHSKSPLIHAMFAEQTGQQLEYGKLLAPLDNFIGSVRDFLREGRGVNVTVPFKEQAWALVDEHTPAAERAGAVNTIMRREDGSLLGDNTDGKGLVRDIEVNAGLSLKGLSVLLVGAGGAARGVIQPLLAAGPQHLCVINRTVHGQQGGRAGGAVCRSGADRRCRPAMAGRAGRSDHQCDVGEPGR